VHADTLARVRAFVTGATGFIGGHLTRALRGNGDDVVALVRSRGRAEALDAEVIEGGLGDDDAIARGVDGADAVFHVAAAYRVGIPPSERAAMYETNVGGTERVLDAAIAARVPRIVYVSTVNAFGDTHGRVVDETYERPGDDFVSAYDETKWLAHEAAKERIARGAPVLIAQPGVVYGPGDTSQIGGQIRAAMAGKLRYVSFPTLAFNAVHVADVVTGLLLIYERGRVGESYVLGGELSTMRELIEKAARVSGRRPPRFELPTALVRALAPVAPLFGRALGLPPNLRELVSASHAVTYWATDAKARRELGYTSRDLDTGLRDLAALERKLP
jgi:nucleoside-diphosphate-sugar epimerase